MPAEMLDVVDEDDRLQFRVHASASTASTTSTGSVMFFVFDDDGNVFVNQRSAAKETYPSY
ncbi:MAG: hypothetical protein U0531_12775 [Dehalococcoidia bacterium]